MGRDATAVTFSGPALAPVEHEDRRALLELVPGRVVAMAGAPGSGLTRLALAMLAAPSRLGPVAAVDVRGWLCPSAAWDVGIAPDRLVVVRCAERDRWAQVVAALVEGVAAVYAEVPAGIPDQALRRLAALVRARRSALVLRPLRGDVPGGVAQLSLEASRVVWGGTGMGVGRLAARRLTLEARGKAMRGMSELIEVEDDGTDAVRLVSPVGAAPVGVATG